MIALIDGDLLVHQFCSPKDVDKPTGGKNGSYRFPFKSTVKAIGNRIDQIVRDTACEGGIVCFSDTESNFRKDFFPEYKAHRTNRKPIMMADAIQYVMDEFECRLTPTLEADDVMGIMSTSRPGKYVICSFDKDMKTIPGAHYDWRGDFAEVTEVDAINAFRLWTIQIMQGDSADGFKGARGFGAVGAAGVADGFAASEDGWWEDIVSAFKGDREDALTNARCARILWSKDWDFDADEPILWEPPTCGDAGEVL